MKTGLTPLFTAAVRGHAKCIPPLLEAGADVNHSDKVRDAFNALILVPFYQCLNHSARVCRFVFFSRIFEGWLDAALSGCCHWPL